MPPSHSLSETHTMTPKSSSNTTTNPNDALKQWEHENNVKEVDYDELFKYDEDENAKILQERPWKDDPKYFKSVKISALALLKMIMHARSGGNLEVMGMLQGKVVGKSFIVLDTFALPVEGTETRVNAGAQAIEYTGRYVDMSQEVGRNENLCGWYHSHPGYLCWLSGIDLNTQQMNQGYQDPWVAIVVDPIHTISSGKVTIGAFRSYPEGYTEESQSSSYKSIPKEKIQDFGVHWKYYYELDIEIFKSSTDAKLLSLVWNKYWIKTLSSTPLIVNKDYITQQTQDLSSKLKEAQGSLSRGNKFAGVYHHVENGNDEEPNALENLNRDNCKLACEALRGLITFQVKDSLFNVKPQKTSQEGGDNNANEDRMQD